MEIKHLVDALTIHLIAGVSTDRFHKNEENFTKQFDKTTDEIIEEARESFRKSRGKYEWEYRAVKEVLSKYYTEK